MTTKRIKRGAAAAPGYKPNPVPPLKGRVISHNPTPETAAAIARMEAGEFTEIKDTKAWLRGLGVIK